MTLKEYIKANKHNAMLNSLVAQAEAQRENDEDFSIDEHHNRKENAYEKA